MPNSLCIFIASGCIQISSSSVYGWIFSYSTTDSIHTNKYYTTRLFTNINNNNIPNLFSEPNIIYYY